MTVSAAKALAMLNLTELQLAATCILDEALKALVATLIEREPPLSKLVFHWTTIITRAGLMYLLQNIYKLKSLRTFLLLERVSDLVSNKMLESALRQCARESSTLSGIGLIHPDRSLHFDRLKAFLLAEDAEFQHELNLNKAGVKRAVRELATITPTGLAVFLLDRAHREYQADGIYYLLREHENLQNLFASS
mmetsp:Transcript_6187/g.10675  ORF Transcript_6187/g.10675 Transcript_6187/m.10675 type:complete len:193 (+) Transcript_6187:248-826(+)